jgi:nitroimidazol reductase NimA-like FMN-containing flavoprotein (pyridoxamine 5'-phosphate oxidase superfamily)
MKPALRDEILAILAGANDMTLATIRGDGYPQATTVSYTHDGLTLYFGCAADSQKARNLAREDKVSLTINLPYAHWGEIRGLSMGGRATLVRNPQEMERAGQLLQRKFPEGIAEYASDGMEGVALFRVVPEVISVLDYRKGFGHTDLVSDPGAPDDAPGAVGGADEGSFPASDPPAWTRTTAR